MLFIYNEFVAGGAPAEEAAHCHELYAKFEKAHHAEGHASFDFRPVVLTPFYRSEVWQLYLADGVKIFRNKELAVKIAEVYANVLGGNSNPREGHVLSLTGADS